MWMIFKRRLLTNWLVILGWGLGLGVLGFYMFSIYDAFLEQNIDLAEIMAAMPVEMMVFFGDNTNIATPEGFLTVEFFSYIPVILGIVAIAQASGLLTGKEEDGTLELIMAQPVSRRAIFWSEVLALVSTLVLILFIIWMGFWLGAEWTPSFKLTGADLLNPFLSLFALLLFYAGFALLLSMVLPSSKSAHFICMISLIGSYFVTSLERIEDGLAFINLFSPLRYYQTGEALFGLKAGYLLILLYYALVFFLLAGFIFSRRDMHFGISSSMRIALPGTHSRKN